MDRGSMSDPAAVVAQYASPDNLRTRMAVWRPGPDGISPREVAVDAVVSLRPRRVLEIGCGTGELAAEVLARLPGCDYLATDRSPAMVAATAAHGVGSVVADAAVLPVADDAADVVVAAWMLYHVPDLDAALREVGRVLRPGGTLVAVTNGQAHLAALLVEAGGAPLVTQFTSENGTATLERHFGSVGRRDVPTVAHFEDHAAAVRCLASFDPELAAGLPAFEGARQYDGLTTVFTAA